MSDFKSKLEGHALQREEKIDIMYRLIKENMKSEHPDVFNMVRERWRSEVEMVKVRGK